MVGAAAPEKEKKKSGNEQPAEKKRVVDGTQWDPQGLKTNALIL